MNITVLGSGVVGQATGRGMIERGHDVTFLDTNVDLVKRLSHEGLTTAVVGADDLPKIYFDVLMVAVGTPSREGTRTVNLDYICEGVKTVGQILKYQEGQPVVVIRSTVPPHTTENILLPLIEAYSRRRVGEGFGLCMNPEFLRAKSSVEDFAHPWATVIGEYDSRSGDVLEELYRPFGGRFFRVSLAEAELIKYIHNIRNALIISFSNEIWGLGEALGVDANKALEVVTHTAESAWNPLYGCTGGRPYGGTCLPKDTNALHKHAESSGVSMPLLQAVIEVNDHMLFLAQHGEVTEAQAEGLNWMQSPNLT